MRKIIIGFSGLLASGKGTAAKYLEQKYKASSYRFSTIMRDMLHRIYLEQTRDNMIKMSETIRATFGEEILAKTIAKDAENDINPIVVVDGIRRLADITHLTNLDNFILVEIFAEPQTRFQRLVKRGENPDDTTKTFEQFLADHERSTEKTIQEVIPFAKEKIDNNGTFDELYAQIDAFIEKYADKN